MSFDCRSELRAGNAVTPTQNGSFRKLGVPYFGVLIIRILLFRVLYEGPQIFGNSQNRKATEPNPNPGAANIEALITYRNLKEPQNRGFRKYGTLT